MSGPVPNQDIFDVRRIRRLVELMKEHELNEIDLRQGETRIKLRRGGEEPVVVAAGPRPLAPAALVPEPARPAGPAALPEAKAESGMEFIKSPMVGTFYPAPEPESPPYVTPGDHVGPDTIVCMIEAMKVFNEIPAELSGRIVAVLVENGAPVEFGQPLFRIEKSG